MNLRRAFYFIVSLLMTAGIALAQQPAPPPAPPQASTDDLSGNAYTFLLDGGSFLGVYAEDISKENMSRYGLRDVRGVGITGIVKDSPAEKAGLKKDDVILRFDGENVTSVRKLTRLVSEVAPDQTVRIGISRSGAEQEVAVTVSKRDHSAGANFFGDGFKSFERLKDFGPGAHVWNWEGPVLSQNGNVFSLGSYRRIGVSTMQLTKQLADYFGIADGKGVLVTSVEEDGPAAKAGVKAGDVIIAADGEKTETGGDLSRAINKKKDGTITLTLIRNKSQQSITITPKESGHTIIQPGSTPQARTIVIPEIVVPSIPSVNVRVPNIQIPVIPEVNVHIPALPKIRVKRTQQPI
jgi:membrane-associated protease RseP (regulator of RpoE activity)